MAALVRDHLVRRRGMTEAARSAAIVVLAGTTLAAGGCGSSGGPASSTTTTAPTATTSKPPTSIAGAEVGRLPKAPEPTRPTSLAAPPATSGVAFFSGTAT